MPNIKAEEKSLRQNVKRRARNRLNILPIRTLNKEIVTAYEAKDKEKAEKLYSEYVVLIDKSARKGIVKKTSAARKKSRLRLMLNKLTATS